MYIIYVYIYVYVYIYIYIYMRQLLSLYYKYFQIEYLNVIVALSPYSTKNCVGVGYPTQMKSTQKT